MIDRALALNLCAIAKREAAEGHDHIAEVLLLTAKEVREGAAEIERLQELLRGVGANRYWEGRWRDAKAEIEMLRAIARRLVDESQEFGSPMNRTMTEARALLGGSVQEPGMTQEEVVAFTRAAKARTLLGEVGVSPPRQSDLDGFDRAKAHSGVQSPPDRFEQAVRRMNELTDGMEVDPDDEIADEADVQSPTTPQERLADIFDALNTQQWSRAAALAYPYRRHVDKP